MTILIILQYPDLKLKRKGKKVENFSDPTFQTVVDDVLDTVINGERCAALAATQLDLPDPPHLTVINYPPYHGNIPQPLCLINGEIISREGVHLSEEGCMSVTSSPDYPAYAKTKRPHKVRFKGQDRHGNAIEYEAEGEMAKCIDHELDHLDGKIFLDRLSGLKRARVEDRIRKAKKY